MFVGLGVSPFSVLSGFPDYVERVTVVPSVPVATPAPVVSESRGKVGSEPPLAVQPTYTAMEKVVAPPTPAVVAADDAMLAQLRSRAIMSQDITTGGHPSSAKYAQIAWLRCRLAVCTLLSCVVWLQR